MSEMGMVDRAARMIFGFVTKAAPDAFHPSYERDAEAVWIPAARAAIEAMRAPTESMQKAGFLANKVTNYDPCDRPTCISRITMPADKPWQAMIDAALAEPTS